MLDDGWFGHRDADDSSLGDWVVDRRKLPDGLDGLGRAIEALGLEFGLWIEPEMVSPDSDLYRRPSRLGDRHRRPEARRRAASSSSSTWVGRRSSTTSSAPLGRSSAARPITLRQVGHEPQHHRAVRARRSRPTARAKFFHRHILGVVRAVSAPDRPASRRSCSSRVPAAGGGSTRAAGLRAAGLDERRHRCDRAAGHPVGHLAGLPAQRDGGPRLGRPEPPDGPRDAARDEGGRRLLRRPRLRARPDGPRPRTSGAEVRDQVAFYVAPSRRCSSTAASTASRARRRRRPVTSPG